MSLMTARCAFLRQTSAASLACLRVLLRDGGHAGRRNRRCSAALRGTDPGRHYSADVPGVVRGGFSEPLGLAFDLLGRQNVRARDHPGHQYPPFIGPCGRPIRRFRSWPGRLRGNRSRLLANYARHYFDAEPVFFGNVSVRRPGESQDVFDGGRSDNFANFEGRMAEVAIFAVYAPRCRTVIWMDEDIGKGSRPNHGHRASQCKNGALHSGQLAASGRADRAHADGLPPHRGSTDLA